ncbi:MAG: beta-ketoacyl-ACP synthase III [Gemmatimonadaceae bacterium]
MSGRAFITAVGAFLPGEPVSNADLETTLGLVNGKASRSMGPVLRSNGITSRYYAIDRETGLPSYSSAAMAAEAVRQLATDVFSLDDVDCLACGTSLPEQILPNIGSMVHAELALKPIEVMATSGVCLSGVAAMKYAMMGVKSGEFQHAVAAASERASGALRGRFFNSDSDAAPSEFVKRPSLAFEKDFLRFMLSDGAGAVLIEPEPAKSGLSLRMEWIVGRSYANEMDTCMYAGAEKMPDGSLKSWMDYEPEQWLTNSVFAIKQDAKQLNEHIIRYTVEYGLQEVVRTKQLDPNSITWFLPHYSSMYFRDKVAAGMERVGFAIPQERWFSNLTTKGNTGSASIYIMLEELFHSGKLNIGDRLLCYVPESGRFSTGFILLTVCGPDEQSVNAA